jgi:hypothetical protein
VNVVIGWTLVMGFGVAMLAAVVFLTFAATNRRRW